MGIELTKEFQAGGECLALEGRILGTPYGFDSLGTNFKHRALQVANYARGVESTHGYGAHFEVKPENPRIRIVFRPGLLGFEDMKMMQVFAKHLSDKFSAHVFLPESARGYAGLINVCSVEDGAEQMCPQVEKFLEHSNEDLPVYFCGHSKGGVDIIKCYSDFMEERYKGMVEGVICLNSPVNGSHVGHGTIPKLFVGKGLVDSFCGEAAWAERQNDLENLKTDGVAALFTSGTEDLIVRTTSAMPAIETPENWLLTKIQGNHFRPVLEPETWMQDVPVTSH